MGCGAGAVGGAHSYRCPTKPLLCACNVGHTYSTPGACRPERSPASIGLVWPTRTHEHPRIRGYPQNIENPDFGCRQKIVYFPVTLYSKVYGCKFLAPGVDFKWLKSCPQSFRKSRVPQPYHFEEQMGFWITKLLRYSAVFFIYGLDRKFLKNSRSGKKTKISLLFFLKQKKL